MSDAVRGPTQARLSRHVNTGLGIMIGVLIMTASAKTQIPFWPVPMTLHTLAVMAFAVMAGPQIATSIFIAYLAAGAVGLPVFSNAPERGVGIAYLLGPTGGYLAGYLIACWLVGTLAHGKRTLGRVGAMLCGLVPIYGLGVAWLTAYLPTSQLIALGVAPFLLGDLVKIGVVAVAALAMPSLAGSREWRS